MSAGLLASTATPGSGAPDGSLTEPAIAAWANALVVMPVTASRTSNPFIFQLLLSLHV